MTDFPVPIAATRDTAAPEPQGIWCPHVTVACIIADADRFLMVEEDIHGDRQFNQPSGHLEPAETLAVAAVRETLEETGWDVALDSFVGAQQWHSPIHQHAIVRFTFAGHALRHHPERKLDSGIVRALWMRYPEVMGLGGRLRSPLVLASLNDWLAGQRWPLSTLRSWLPVGAA